MLASGPYDGSGALPGDTTAWWSTEAEPGAGTPTGTDAGAHAGVHAGADAGTHAGADA
jgi:alpha-glucosidase